MTSRLAFVLSAVMLAALLAISEPASATIRAVDCNADPSTALQDAITAASNGDVLDIDGDCQGQFVIPGSFSGGLTLRGHSAGAALDGAGGGTTLTVQSGAVVTLDQITVLGGSGATGAAGVGLPGAGGAGGAGGIASAGTLTITRSTITGNAGGVGGGGATHFYQGGDGGWGGPGGIRSSGTLSITDSTIYGNVGGAGGTGGAASDPTIGIGGDGGYAGAGGIGLYGSGTTMIEASTISSNTGASGGSGGFGLFAMGSAGHASPGGVQGSGTTTLESSILAANSGPIKDCDFSLSSGGYNIVGSVTNCSFSATGTDMTGTDGTPVDPQLSSLASNGGRTATMAIADTSPALDQIPDIDCQAIDQRGVARPQKAACDIGAFELEPPATTLTIKAPKSVASGAKAKITGALSSDEPSCLDSMLVEIKSGSKTLGSAMTDGTGAYQVKVRIKRKTTVQASFAGTIDCGASQSEKRTIRIT